MRVDIQTAINIAREVETFVSNHGWHVALGGGVMKRGFSENDMDLIVFPHKTREEYPAPDVLVKRLCEAGVLGDPKFRDHSAYGDDKIVYKCVAGELGNVLVDLIFP